MVCGFLVCVGVFFFKVTVTEINSRFLPPPTLRILLFNEHSDVLDANDHSPVPSEEGTYSNRGIRFINTQVGGCPKTSTDAQE